ncbi:MAG: pyocin knob domain-containing protein [Peptostreptococcaceae bacterium]
MAKLGFASKEINNIQTLNNSKEVNNITLQDHLYNVYHPETNTDIVIDKDGNKLSDTLTQLKNTSENLSNSKTEYVEITSGNLNDYIDDGHWQVSSTSNAQLIENTPFIGAYFLDIYKVGSTIIQIASQMLSYNSMQRRFYQGAWEPWFSNTYEQNKVIHFAESTGVTINTLDSKIPFALIYRNADNLEPFGSTGYSYVQQIYYGVGNNYIQIAHEYNNLNTTKMAFRCINGSNKGQWKLVNTTDAIETKAMYEEKLLILEKEYLLNEN